MAIDLTNPRVSERDSGPIRPITVSSFGKTTCAPVPPAEHMAVAMP
jgi:hypothetical protein